MCHCHHFKRASVVLNAFTLLCLRQRHLSLEHGSSSHTENSVLIQKISTHTHTTSWWAAFCFYSLELWLFKAPDINRTVFYVCRCSWLLSLSAVHPLPDFPSFISLVNILSFVHTSCFPTYLSVDIWVASILRLLGTCYFKWICKFKSSVSILQGYTQKGDCWITWWFHL